MRNKFCFIFVNFLVINFLIFTPIFFDASSSFGNILKLSSTAIEKQVSIGSKRIFDNGIEQAIKKFNDIANEIEDCFLEHKKIHKKFEQLCKTIVLVSNKIAKASSVKPWHINRLKTNIDDFCKSVEKVADKVWTPKEKKFVYLVQEFSEIMNRRVYFYLLENVGTKFEKLQEKFLYKPMRFYWRNKYVTIPATTAAILLTKATWDARQYSKECRQHLSTPPNPDSWDVHTVTEPTKEKKGIWKGFVVGLAGILFSKLLAGGDGFVMTTDGRFVNEPIGTKIPDCDKKQVAWGGQFREDQQRDERDIVEFVRTDLPGYEFERSFENLSITQLPCIRQSGVDCGYHALYNAVCLFNADYRGLVFRDEHNFDKQLEDWKAYLQQKGERVRNGLDAVHVGDLVNHFDFFALIKRLGAGEGEIDIFVDNVSLVGNLNQLIGQFRRNAGDNNPLFQSIFQNMQRFRNDSANNPQVIILHTGGYHWIALKIERNRDNTGDHMIVVDSINHDYRHRELLMQVYYMFKTDPHNFFGTRL